MGLRLRLKNDATPIREDWWKWKVWVDGTDQDLGQIKSVKYVLHPTFPNPIRIVEDRHSKFALSSAGWGEFAITAHILTTNDKTVTLEHWIEFRQPGATAASKRRPSVFLSFSATDRYMARVLKESLENQGVEVLSADDVAQGDSWKSALNEGIGRAQVVGFLISGELRGFAEQELALAQQSAKHVVPILMDQGADVPQPFEHVQVMHMLSANDAGPVADVLAARAKNLFDEDVP